MASCSDYLCEFEAKFAMFMGLETDEIYFQEKFKRRKIFQHSSLKETHEVKLFFERPESNRLQKFSLSLSLKKNSSYEYEASFILLQDVLHTKVSNRQT
jgi:hypothetical protein